MNDWSVHKALTSVCARVSFHIPGCHRLLGVHLQTGPLLCSGPTLSCLSGSHNPALSEWRGEEKRRGKKDFLRLLVVFHTLHALGKPVFALLGPSAWGSPGQDNRDDIR